jgi:hypothetical protein
VIPATPPACYAAVGRYYAVPGHREVGPFHFTVFTDGGWAVAAWSSTHSGGEGIFRRRNGRWCVVVNSGGAFRTSEMAHYGMPRAVAERLNAKMKRGA